MKTTIGFEVELFTYSKGKLISPALNDLPYDANGMLLEMRGNASSSIEEAYFSIFAQLAVWDDKLKGFTTRRDVDWEEKNEAARKEQREYLRRFGEKKRLLWQNLYELEPSPKNDTYFSAGLHIHFKGEEECYDSGTKQTYTRPVLFDFPRVFRAIEKEFDADMKRSERTKGFYEIKGDGRVEYRSLPSSLFFQKDFLKRLKSCELFDKMKEV